MSEPRQKRDDTPLTPATRAFQELNVWNEAHRLVLDVFRMTRDFPSDEKFGITSQIRRAATSVPANIAEGYIRRSPTEAIRFYNIVRDSLEEVRDFLIPSREPGCRDTRSLQDTCCKGARMLRSYIHKIEQNPIQ